MLNEWNGVSTYAGGETCEGLRSRGLGRCSPRGYICKWQRTRVESLMHCERKEDGLHFNLSKDVDCVG